MFREVLSKCARPFKSVENQLQNLRTMKAIYESMPTTSVTKVSNLSNGAHIMLNSSDEDHDHAIVTDIDHKDRKLTVIKCICKDKNTPNSKTEIKEETIDFKKDRNVFLVNYQGSNRNNETQKFTRMPEKVSVEVARHFKDNRSAYTHSKLMKDCEHFAFCCTLGYPINHHEMNLLMVAFGALKIFDRSDTPDMNDFMDSKDRLAQYDELKHLLQMTSERGEVTNIFF